MGLEQRLSGTSAARLWVRGQQAVLQAHTTLLAHVAQLGGTLCSNGSLWWVWWHNKCWMLVLWWVLYVARSLRRIFQVIGCFPKFPIIRENSLYLWKHPQYPLLTYWRWLRCCLKIGGWGERERTGGWCGGLTWGNPRVWAIAWHMHTLGTLSLSTDECKVPLGFAHTQVHNSLGEVL